MSEECIDDLAIALRDQLILVDDLHDQLEEAKANHENAVAHMQSVCAERDHLRSLIIERETIRIGQGLQRHDGQKQIDELVSLGIQQDKDEIAKLKAEVESLCPDAARYRWIEPVFAGLFGIDSMDQYIDRAMAKEQQ